MRLSTPFVYTPLSPKEYPPYEHNVMFKDFRQNLPNSFCMVIWDVSMATSEYGGNQLHLTRDYRNFAKMHVVGTLQ
jgi:hypothetical protein